MNRPVAIEIPNGYNACDINMRLCLPLRLLYELLTSLLKGQWHMCHTMPLGGQKGA